VLCTRACARSLATMMISFRLGLYVVLPKSSAGLINFIWTTYLENYHNCSTLYGLPRGILGVFNTNFPTDHQSFSRAFYFISFIFFRVLLNFLVTKVRKVSYGVNKENHETQLAIWDSGCRILKSLLDVIKPMSHPRALIGTLLKGSRLFLDHFLKHCMPLMDRLFSRRRDDCIALLKIMQTCTRYIEI
jgi:hypothetical protein